MTEGEIIVALGGTGKLAADLGKDKSTISCWRQRGIPSVYWLRISKLAKRRGKGRQINLHTLAKREQARMDSSWK